MNTIRLNSGRILLGVGGILLFIVFFIILVFVVLPAWSPFPVTPDSPVIQSGVKVGDFLAWFFHVGK